MKIAEIIISDTKPSLWDNKVVKVIMESILVIPLAIFMTLTIIIGGMFELILDVFKLKPRKRKVKEKVIFKNEYFKIIEDKTGPSNIDKIAADFLDNIVCYDDEMEILKVKSIPANDDFDNHFITDFIIMKQNELILQRIITKDNQPHSELISFDINSGKTEKLADIGLFYLYKYKKYSNTILGYNKEKDIKIKLIE